MNGWGRAVFLVTVGLALGAGCGGRTGSPYDGDYDPDPEGGTNPGAAGSGGRPGTAGKSTGGSRPGTGGRPIAGDSFGGAPGTAGGISPSGGFATGGVAGFPTGGFAFGGFGGGSFAGAFPTGGFAGFAGGPPQDCQQCILQTCGGSLQQCFQDFGCIAIFTCVAQTGCDTFDCTSPDTCGPVIDQFGGPFGPSMSTLLDVVSCTLTSGCPCN
jgi:hypothetical protein